MTGKDSHLMRQLIEAETHAQELTISPTAASNPPCRSHEKATRAMGRYGAVILLLALRQGRSKKLT